MTTTDSQLAQLRAGDELRQAADYLDAALAHVRKSLRILEGEGVEGSAIGDLRHYIVALTDGHGPAGTPDLGACVRSTARGVISHADALND